LFDTIIAIIIALFILRLLFKITATIFKIVLLVALIGVVLYIINTFIPLGTFI